MSRTLISGGQEVSGRHPRGGEAGDKVRRSGAGAEVRRSLGAEADAGVAAAGDAVTGEDGQGEGADAGGPVCDEAAAGEAAVGDAVAAEAVDDETVEAEIPRISLMSFLRSVSRFSAHSSITSSYRSSSKALSRMEEVTLGIHLSRKSIHMYSSVSSAWVKLWPCFLLEARRLHRVMRTYEALSSSEVTLARSILLWV